jgi:SAM-dependent methyltransferase
MTRNEPIFDPNRYKQTTRQQWERAAEAWHRWGPLLNKWLGPATERMLDLADIGPGARVLDVAAGAGEQSLAVARRIGREGRVLATDISPSILAYAESSARAHGFDNVGTRVLDGEDLNQLEKGSFDAVISRVGMIYFPDQQKALAGMKHAVKPGGKVAAIVYSTAERNAFFSVPVSIIRRRANLPPPLPGQPGPFSLGAPNVLEQAFAKAGFRDIKVETMDAPIELDTASECLNFEKESFGALHQMLSGLNDRQQEDAWTEIEQALEKFESDGRFTGPCELVLAVGTR